MYQALQMYLVWEHKARGMKGWAQNCLRPWRAICYLYTWHLSIVETEEGYCIPAKLGLHSFEKIK